MDIEKGQLELRCEELDLEELFWNFIRLQRRVDDLESGTANALLRLAAAETKDERMEAIAVVEAVRRRMS